MKTFVKKIFVLLIMCGLSITILNCITQNNDGHYVYRMMKEMYSSEENIDVLFLGSSHVYRTYDPIIADEILGIKTFNAGSSSQGMNTSYYLLKEINKKHSLKTVYLDTFYGMANLSENDAQVFIVSDYMKMGINKLGLLISSGKIETLFGGYVKVNRGSWNIVGNIKSYFSKIDDYSSVTYDNEEYRGDGFVYSFEICDSNDENTYISYAGGADLRGEHPVNALYEKYLLKIIDYCKDNNIELVLVNQPMPTKTMDYVMGYDNFVQYIKILADKAEVKYWNFDLYNGELNLSMEDYKDGGHLNGQGAEKYTLFFCDFINAYNGGTDVSSYFRDHY